MPQAEVSLEPAVKKMPRPKSRSSLSPPGKPKEENKKDPERIEDIAVLEESGDSLEAPNSKVLFFL